MIKLPVLHTPSYLSPSSLSEWERCNYKFYLKRMCGDPYPYQPPTLAAAAGTAFDCFFKGHYARKIGFEGDPRFDIETMLANDIEDDSIRPHAIEVGRRLFAAYIKSPAPRFIQAEGGVVSIELDNTVELQHDGVCIPVRGKPDVILGNGMVLELKVQGAGSTSGASPTQGYLRGWRDGQTLKPHKRAGEPLEQINRGWARQLVFYDWLFKGVSPMRKIYAAVDNVTIRQTKITVTQIRTHISQEFVEETWNDLVQSWEEINSGSVRRASPAPVVCHAYGSLCEVAERCEEYQKWQARSEEDKDLYGG